MTKQNIIDSIPDDWNYTEYNGFAHIRDADGNICIRIDPPDKVTNYLHVHAYDSDGNLLDSGRDIISIQEAYVVMYNILDDYYCRESENDSLASLLSDMDPNIFSDKKAADPATYEDWYNCVSCYIKNGEMREKNIIVALKEFLIYYQQEFGYHLEDVINFISDKGFPIS